MLTSSQDCKSQPRRPAFGYLIQIAYRMLARWDIVGRVYKLASLCEIKREICHSTIVHATLGSPFVERKGRIATGRDYDVQAGRCAIQQIHKQFMYFRAGNLVEIVQDKHKSRVHGSQIVSQAIAENGCRNVKVRIEELLSGLTGAREFRIDRGGEILQELYKRTVGLIER